MTAEPTPSFRDTASQSPSEGVLCNCQAHLRPPNLKMSTSPRRKLTIRKLGRSVARLLFRVYNVQYTYKPKQTVVHLDLRVFRTIFLRPPRSVRCQITTDWSILVDNRLGGSNGLRKNSRSSCTTVSLDFYVWCTLWNGNKHRPAVSTCFLTLKTRFQ